MSETKMKTEEEIEAKISYWKKKKNIYFQKLCKWNDIEKETDSVKLKEKAKKRADAFDKLYYKAIMILETLKWVLNEEE